MEVKFKGMRDYILDEVAHLITDNEHMLLASRDYRGIAAYIDDEPVGVVICSKYDDGIATFERIYVEEEYRRQGIGKIMMNVLFEYVRSIKYNLVLKFQAESDEDEFLQFLLSLDNVYIERENKFEAVLSTEEVEDICRTYAPKAGKPLLYFEQTKNIQHNFKEILSKEYPIIAWQLKNDQMSFRKDLCCCVVDKGEIAAVCLMKENREDEELELSFLYALPEKGQLAAKALVDMIGQVAKAGAMPMRINVVNEASARILAKLSKNYVVTKQGYAAYYICV